MLESIVFIIILTLVIIGVGIITSYVVDCIFAIVTFIISAVIAFAKNDNHHWKKQKAVF